MEDQRQVKRKTKVAEKQKSKLLSEQVLRSNTISQNLQSLKPGEEVAGSGNGLMRSTRAPGADLKAQSPSECGGFDSTSRTLSGQHQAEAKERQHVFEKCAMHVAIACYTDNSKRRQAELVTHFISYRKLKKLLSRI